MASRQDPASIGRDTMGCMTVHFRRQLTRGAFGWFRWRLFAATKLLVLACRVLRCNAEIEDSHTREATE